MHVNFRPARPADLPRCLLLMRDLYAFQEAGQQTRLLEMWRELHASRAGRFLVFEDLLAPPDARICSFCLIVFVNEAFACALKNKPASCMGLLALHWWSAGKSPFLKLPDIQRANSSVGLTLVCLHSGCLPQFLGHAGREVREKRGEGWYYAGGGYRIQEAFAEAQSPQEKAWLTGAGFRVVREHDPAGAALYGVSRKSDGDAEGTLAARLLNVRPPCLGLRPKEQYLLCWALLGLTDEEIARELDITLVCARKRWENIYSRAEFAVPDLLPVDASRAGRGPEKRRRLLQYVRSHMEELRPGCFQEEAAAPRENPWPLRGAAAEDRGFLKPKADGQIRREALLHVG